jgi:hypothetical protein
VLAEPRRQPVGLTGVSDQFADTFMLRIFPSVG